MSRRRRIAPAGFVYHVMNRAAGRQVLFEKPSDYNAFEDILSLGQRHTPMRIIAYCLMRTHWHLLLWPERDGTITTFMHWVTTVHARRWVLAHDAVGRGAVYQSRFKAIAVQPGQHLFTVWRYIERNPIRANLVRRAELWPWSSLSGRQQIILSIPPTPVPDNWIERVNLPQTNAELNAVRRCLDTGAPYGDLHWRASTDAVVGWRRHGRPKKDHISASDLSEKGVRPLFQFPSPF